MVKNRPTALEKRLLALVKVLEKLRSEAILSSYGLIGGFAVGALGVPRATKDIGFLVSTNDAQGFLKKLKETLSRKGFNPVIEMP